MERGDASRQTLWRQVSIKGKSFVTHHLIFWQNANFLDDFLVWITLKTADLHSTAPAILHFSWLFYFYILVPQQRFVPCPVTNNARSIREETASGLWHFYLPLIFSISGRWSWTVVQFVDHFLCLVDSGCQSNVDMWQVLILLHNIYTWLYSHWQSTHSLQCRWLCWI